MSKRFLHLFDVSNYISAGIGNTVVSRGVKQDQGVYRSREMPVAGINCMLNAVHELQNADSELVFCCDRLPTIKRELHALTFPYSEGYKGNRSRKANSTVIQRDVIEEVLTQCGFNVLAADGYESDDIIATLVANYSDAYEHTYIHTRDSDLFYLVNPRVSIAKVGVAGKVVTLDNWEYAVKKDYITPYNTITLNKLICGESSDNIQAISKLQGDKILKHITEDKYFMCGDNDVLLSLVKEATGNDQVVVSTLKLIMPLILPRETVELSESEFDLRAFVYYAASFGNKYYKRHDASFYPLGAETIDRYIDIYLGGE